MGEVLSFPWTTFCRLQTATNSPIINARTKGCEEALTVIVDEMAVGKIPPNEEAMERRYRTLSANRSVKYVNRKEIQIDESRSYGSAVMDDISEALAIEELGRLAYSQLTPEEWRLLEDVGEGESYVNLSKDQGKKVGTLKSMVSRARSRIRKSSVSHSIRVALGQSRSDGHKWDGLRHRRTAGSGDHQ